MGSQAQLTFTNGGLMSNTARSGGGLYLAPNAVVTLTGNTLMSISGNSAQAGGGIYNGHGTMTLTNSTPGWAGWLRS
jgi:hypothetical protein